MTERETATDLEEPAAAAPVSLSMPSSLPLTCHIPLPFLLRGHLVRHLSVPSLQPAPNTRSIGRREEYCSLTLDLPNPVLYNEVKLLYPSIFLVSRSWSRACMAEGMKSLPCCYLDGGAAGHCASASDRIWRRWILDGCSRSQTAVSSLGYTSTGDMAHEKLCSWQWSFCF